VNSRSPIAQHELHGNMTSGAPNRTEIPGAGKIIGSED
jgi:hypothetical protein